MFPAYTHGYSPEVAWTAPLLVLSQVDQSGKTAQEDSCKILYCKTWKRNGRKTWKRNGRFLAGILQEKWPLSCRNLAREMAAFLQESCRRNGHFLVGILQEKWPQESSKRNGCFLAGILQEKWPLSCWNLAREMAAFLQESCKRNGRFLAGILQEKWPLSCRNLVYMQCKNYSLIACGTVARAVHSQQYHGNKLAIAFGHPPPRSMAKSNDE